MEENNARQNLHIQTIQLEHLKQFNELLRYVFQVTNQDLFESGYEEGELIRAKRPLLEIAEVIGWFDKEVLVSQICIIPCEVNIQGSIFKMGGITGVGTYPEYANLGLMNELILLSLRQMQKNKQWISYLYPYSIPYYRRKGWEIMSDKINYTIEDTQFPDIKNVKGYVSRRDVDHEDVFIVYNEFAHKNHGAMIRKEFNWAEYWRWENEDERIAAIYYDELDVPKGYMMYWIENDIFYIKEMIYLNQEARNGLWNFVSAHFSMIDKVKGHTFKNEPIAFNMKDPCIIETIKPYYMARIVDVENFLKCYPFAEIERPFHFVVTDNIATWNNGVFGIEGDKNGNILVAKKEIGKPVFIDINSLSSMLMSYRLPSYYYEYELLKTDPETLKTLERIIPSNQPYFSDYF